MKHTNRALRLFSIVFATLTIAACGGGGDDGESAQQERIQELEQRLVELEESAVTSVSGTAVAVSEGFPEEASISGEGLNLPVEGEILQGESVVTAEEALEGEIILTDSTVTDDTITNEDVIIVNGTSDQPPLQDVTGSGEQAVEPPAEDVPAAAEAAPVITSATNSGATSG